MLTSLCLALLLGSSGVAEPAARSQGSVSWITNYPDGLEAARKANKAVFLVFAADWCGPCRVMEREVLNDREVVSLLQSFVCLHIDTDKDRWTAGLYHVDFLPRLLVLDPAGNVLSDRVGYQSKPALMALLSGIPADFGPIAAVSARLKEDPDDFSAWMTAAESYAQLGALDASIVYLNGALKTTEGKSHGVSRELALNKLGLYSLKTRNAKAARKAFERCLAEFRTDGKRCELTMLGLVTALASERRFKDADRVLAELRARFPDSPAVDQAVKNIEEARTAR